ncbi:MAG: hypothetical protein DME06_02050 [Candidatus Rokuibacteriota bacterium]|nr:MAG: hypothetical protein DME06_02050 [Candidatus Rokubacteria bacterium]
MTRLLRLLRWPLEPAGRQRGHARKVVVIGATSGISQIVAAERLGGMGARLMLVTRDNKRGEAALD